MKQKFAQPLKESQNVMNMIVGVDFRAERKRNVSRMIGEPSDINWQRYYADLKLYMPD